MTVLIALAKIAGLWLLSSILLAACYSLIRCALPGGRDD